jgi:predicted MFS family arabinose efflux permease
MLNKTVQLYKNAYAGLSKETWLLGIVILINRSGTMVLPFMSIYCTQQLHFTLSQSGIVMAMFGVGAIFGAQLSGRLTDKFGFYAIQVASLLLGGAMFFVLGELQQFHWLCIGIFIMSFFNESFRPANSAAIAHYSKPENRTRSYAVNRLAINLGFAVGGALGGFLASHNYKLLFWVDGCTNIGAALLLLYLLKPIKVITSTKDKLQLGNEFSPIKDKVYLSFLLLTFCYAFCFMQLFSMHPVFMKTKWLLKENEIGILMAVNGLLIVVIEMVLVHKLEGKRTALFFIRIGMALLMIGFGSLSTLPASFITAAFSMIFITIGEIFCMPFMNTFWVSRTNENNRGRYAALYTTAWSAAHVIAPTAGAFVADSFGFVTLWLCVGLILFALIFLSMFLEQLDKQQYISNT